MPEPLDYAQGAALALNYHTAAFALITRGRLSASETVLVHGAAGGIGTAALQVARGLGARTIAVVSSDEKAHVARQAGAHEVVLFDDQWRARVRELTGEGVDVVIDPVGGDRFTDSLRALRAGGRVVVVGFTGGSIPQVKVNRLLLHNTEVIGAAWPEWVIQRPDTTRTIGDIVTRLIGEGAIRPLVGARLPLEDGPDALRLVEPAPRARESRARDPLTEGVHARRPPRRTPVHVQRSCLWPEGNAAAICTPCWFVAASVQRAASG